MLSIAVTKDNDLFLDARGNLALVHDADAVLQNTVTAMKAQRGEMPLALMQGMPTAATAWRSLDAVAFEASARGVIMSVAGVTGIDTFTMTAEGNVLSYAATIQSIYGPLAIGRSIV